MIVGTAVGALMGHDATVFAPLGAIFINLIKMLVIPLVAVALISGAAGLGNSQSAGKVGLVTLGYFGLTSALAVALALFMGEVFQPGMGIDVSGVEGMFSAEYASKGELPTFWATITGMIPTNVFQSLNEANILQILVFCMFFGIAISKQAKERREPIINGVNCIVDAMVWMINKVMIIAPIGVFGLMAEAVGTFGFGALMVVFKLFVVYVAAILVFGFIVYPAMVHVFTKTSAKKFVSAMKNHKQLHYQQRRQWRHCLSLWIRVKELGVKTQLRHSFCLWARPSTCLVMRFTTAWWLSSLHSCSTST